MADCDARLDAVRREIDALDAALLELLNRRVNAVLEVAAVKGHEAEPRYYRPEREAALLRRLAARNAGPLSDIEVVRLFREIVSTCRALEQRLVIGCATVECSRAALGYFGGAVDIHSVQDAAGALTAIAAAQCDYAVIRFFRGGGAEPVIAEVADRGLALCGEWYAQGGERYVVIGRKPVPPTGDDWTSLAVAAPRVTALESWCNGSNLTMRSTPITGRASSIVDIAAHADDPRLARWVAEPGAGAVLGTYPNAGTDRPPRAGAS